jgi:uncharacterized membrane protein
VDGAALFVHLLGAVVFFAGLAVATVAYAAAWRRDRPAEIALILSLSTVGVALVGAGAGIVLLSGFWLLQRTGYGLGDGWVSAALGLLALSALLGAIGGRKPKQARLVARQRAAEGAADSAEIQRLLRDRAALAANVLAGAAALATLALMVWKPAL